MTDGNKDASGTTVHIYTRPLEPATRYNIAGPVGDVYWVTCSPRRQMRCHHCGRARWASKLGVQVYYDMTRVSCLDPCSPPKRRRRR